MNSLLIFVCVLVYGADGKLLEVMASTLLWSIISIFRDCVGHRPVLFTTGHAYKGRLFVLDPSLDGSGPVRFVLRQMRFWVCTCCPALYPTNSFMYMQRHSV